MKKNWPSVILWLAFGVFLGAVSGYPAPDASTTFIITKRGGGSSKPGPNLPGDPPAFVWRGDLRSPEEIKKANGFHPRNPEFGDNKACSLWQHSEGSTSGNTVYVSTTTDPETARDFGVEKVFRNGKFSVVKHGYIYKIRADGKMVDVPKSLGKHFRYPAQLEQAVLAGIPFDQIEGWYQTEHVGENELEQLRQGHEIKHFNRNKSLNAKYEHTHGSGAQPQLAGFLPNSAAWNEDPWKKFKGQSVAGNLKEFRRKI